MRLLLPTLSSLFGLFCLGSLCLGDSLEVRAHYEKPDNLVGDIERVFDLLHTFGRQFQRINTRIQRVPAF